jgi:hypothetical protein
MPERAPRSAVAGSVSAGELASLRRRATGSADDRGGQLPLDPPVSVETGRRGRGGARAIQTIPEARLWPAHVPGATGANADGAEGMGHRGSAGAPPQVSPPVGDQPARTASHRPIQCERLMLCKRGRGARSDRRRGCKPWAVCRWAIPLRGIPPVPPGLPGDGPGPSPWTPSLRAFLYMRRKVK